MKHRGWLSLGVSLVLSACGGGAGGPTQAVEDHREQWSSSHPQDYVIEICETGFARGCTLGSVSGGQVVAQRTGQAPGELSDTVPSSEEPVAALFARVDAAAGSKNCSVSRLTFDPNYGYVSEYYSDCGEEGSGEQVTCFKPDSLDLSSCAE